MLLLIFIILLFTSSSISIWMISLALSIAVCSDLTALCKVEIANPILFILTPRL
uniref:Uncharacterized protein n=1 Tax=Anguilla anguilla TaxID=7936 RepID=A0A0E9V2C0_ANGAN